MLKVEYGDLDSRTLVLQVYDYDRFSADEMIGHVTYPLSQNDVTRVQNEWRDLQTSSSDDQVLSFDLNHLPRGARGGGGLLAPADMSRLHDEAAYFCQYIN